MDRVLEVNFSGWTATPRMPFIISGGPTGGSVCLHCPTYSIILGIIGCCLGRIVTSDEVQLGFRYSYDSVAKDLEKRQRLQLKNGNLKNHEEGGDVYVREFHVYPKLTIWLNRLDWEQYFISPKGTPALGRSQDILKIESVKQIEVKSVEETEVSGCMLPYKSSLKIGGQLVQVAESYIENDEIGSGRRANRTGVFISIPHDNNAKVKMPNLYLTEGENPIGFYLHVFENES